MTMLLPACPVPLPVSPVVAYTGHRPGARAGGGYGRYRDGSWAWVRQVLPQVLDELGADAAWSGAALGFDTLAGWLTATTGRQLHLAIPFDGHDARWRPDDQARLVRLRQLASSQVVVSPGGYQAWKLHARNDVLVAHGQVMVALWDGQPGGGTAGAVTKAVRAGRPTLVMDPHARMLAWAQDG